jgi:hypothetical protein
MQHSLKREIAYKWEDFSAFWLVSQAECATFVLWAGALRAFISSRLSKFYGIKISAPSLGQGRHFRSFSDMGEETCFGHSWVG